MNIQSGFSINTLFNSLRSQFDLAKEKFSCEQIQEIMNIMTDLEHEVNILQTHYNHVTKQTNQLESINENVLELLTKIASGTRPLNTIPEEYENNQDVVNETIETEVSTTDNVENANTDSDDDIQHLATVIAKLVVEELKVLDSE